MHQRGRIKWGKIIFMLVSDALAREVIPRVHDMRQLDSIHVLRAVKSAVTQWTNKWSKVKAVSTDIRSILESVEQSIHVWDLGILPLSFIPTKNGLPYEEPNQFERSFPYMKLLTETLCHANDNHEDLIKKYAAYCREHGYVPEDALLQGGAKVTLPKEI